MFLSEQIQRNILQLGEMTFFEAMKCWAEPVETRDIIFFLSGLTITVSTTRATGTAF